MTKEELDDLLAVASKDELKELRAAVSERRQQLEEELRNLAEQPPPYMNQREINAEKEDRRKEFNACAVFESEIEGKIFAQIFRGRRL